jgi:hypothetical protein
MSITLFTTAIFFLRLSQINQIRTFQSILYMTNFNITLLSKTRCSEWFLSFTFPHQKSVITTPHIPTCHMTSPPHYSLFTRIILARSTKHGAANYAILSGYFLPRLTEAQISFSKWDSRTQSACID